METIGDVYFVVSGLPERCDNHAELVANQGLDMVMAAKTIKNPLDGSPINVGDYSIDSGGSRGFMGVNPPRRSFFILLVILKILTDPPFRGPCNPLYLLVSLKIT